MNTFETIATPFDRYQQELSNPNWKLKSQYIRKRDNFTCQLCNRKNAQLDVHHLRYIAGREAWQYDDGDLVTLCHDCHEKLHRYNEAKNLIEGDYFYSEILKGVGIIEHKYSDQFWFDICWTDHPHYKNEEGKGRIYTHDESSYEFIRKVSNEEIINFWIKVFECYPPHCDLWNQVGKHTLERMEQAFILIQEVKNTY